MATDRTLIEPQLPLNLDDETRKHLITSSYAVRKLSATELKEVFVTSDGVCLEGLKLVKGCVQDYKKLTREFYWRALRQWFATQITRRAPYKRYSAERRYLLIHHPWFNYYHWMLDSLPRLLQVKEELSQLVLLLPESHASVAFVPESLEYFDFLAVEYIPSGHAAIVPRAVIPEIRPVGRNFCPAELAELRKVFLDPTKEKRSAPVSGIGDKLFISRRSADKRYIRNEDQVLAVLEGYGFRSVDLAEYSLADQIALMQEANYVVAGHGAGLSNILFLRESASVLELAKQPSHRDDFVNGLFFTLCSALSLRYFVQLCKPVDPDIYFVYADIEVPLEKLRENVELMLTT